jgi:hypothetical protein
MDSNNEQLFYMRLGVNSFLEKYRELLSAFDLQQVAEALVAYSSLGNGVLPEKSGIPAYRKYTEEAFLHLYDRGAISPIAPLTELSEADLVKMRRSTGIGAETLPPPPPKPLSAQEQLEQRVSDDWNTLKIGDFKKNCANDKSYREVFERLSAENRLGENTATSLVRAGA